MILLFSEKKDMNVSLIVRWIKYYGYECLRINEDVELQLKKISISNNQNENYIQLSTKGQNILINKKTVVFARRHILHIENINSEVTNPVFQQFINNESYDIKDFISNFITTESKYCLGSFVPRLNKLSQLKCAASIGLNIPETAIINDFDQSLMKRQYITKPISDVFAKQYDSDFYNSGGTLDIDASVLNWEFGFPSLIQRKIIKEVEIRVFFFENNFFSLARKPKIGKSCKKIDWRDYNMNYESMRFFPIDIESSIIKKLKSLSKELNINTGSYDLLFSDGKYYFLEVNPHGQFGFVSSIGSYFVEQKIARFLISKYCL